MVNRRDYTAEKVEAARSVLIELVRLLGEYRDHIVLIGGWVPEMIIAGALCRMSAAWISTSHWITAKSRKKGTGRYSGFCWSGDTGRAISPFGFSGTSS